MAFAVSHFFLSPFTFSSFSWKYKEKFVLLHSKVLRNVRQPFGTDTHYLLRARMLRTLSLEGSKERAPAFWD